MPRPRGFDEGEVLDKAMDVFWRYGYDGASMSELTVAMGLNSPSIYSAFGSKRGLFEAVLERYDERRASYKEAMLSGKTAREVAERVLYGAVRWLTAPEEPRGCLLIQTGLAVGGEGSDIPAVLARRRQRLQDTLTKRFELGRLEGDLPPDANVRDLARYVHTIFSGLAVQASAGASLRDLESVVATALAGWPQPIAKRSKRTRVD